MRLLELKLELQGDDDEGQHNEFAQALQEAEISETKVPGNLLTLSGFSLYIENLRPSIVANQLQLRPKFC